SASAWPRPRRFRVGGALPRRYSLAAIGPIHGGCPGPEGSGQSAWDDPRTSQLAPTPASGLGGVEKPAGSERNGGHHEIGRSKRSSLGRRPRPDEELDPRARGTN